MCVCEQGRNQFKAFYELLLLLNCPFFGPSTSTLLHRRHHQPIAIAISILIPHSSFLIPTPIRIRIVIAIATSIIVVLLLAPSQASWKNVPDFVVN